MSRVVNRAKLIRAALFEAEHDIALCVDCDRRKGIPDAVGSEDAVLRYTHRRPLAYVDLIPSNGSDRSAAPIFRKHVRGPERTVAIRRGALDGLRVGGEQRAAARLRGVR